MASQSKAKLEQRLGECMIRDRFALRKLAGDSKASKQFEKRLARSSALASSRRSLAPKIQYPETLPVVARLDDLKAAIAQHQVIIVAGETGSGKTTQLPKICLELGRGVQGLIGHTQPRRVAARSVAQRLSDELGVDLGEEVGFQIRFGDRTSEKTLIKVMTDGILLAETQTDRFLEHYDTLIIDEAHERSLNIDFLLGYIRRILPKRPDLKVIITSATIDVDRFSEHFFDAPVISVTGRTYPVEVRYRPVEVARSEQRRDDRRDEGPEEVYQALLSALDEIAALERGHRSPGGVLIFLPGEREIREVALLLRKRWKVPAEVLPLYSRLSSAEQNKVFSALTQTRVVLATNVAETSLTVPGIRYVIDTGTARISRYSVTSKVQRLPIEPISRASADQRKGRCGRISDGVCFRLYSEDDFNGRPEFTTPEILRTNLAAVLLQMLQLRLGDPAKFPFIERPEQRQISDGFQLLKELMATDDARRLTRTGRDLSAFPVDLRLARALVEANRFSCLKEVLIIVSALSIQDPRERPADAQQKADEAHRAWQHGQSDFMDFVALWDAYEEQRQTLTQGALRRYCRTHYLSYLRMREWRDIHTQLVFVCRERKYRINRGESDYEQIHRALLSGYLGQISERTAKGDYLGARNRRFHIFPASSLFKKGPRWLMASALVETSRLYARTVCSIEPEWVEAAADHLVKRRHFEPYFDSDRGQVLCFEEVSLFGVVLVKRRKTDYSTLDAVGARGIFIQEALVMERLAGPHKFLKRNAQMIAEVEQLESKRRKRDLLVDHQRLTAFYEQHLPESVLSEIELAAAIKADRSLSQRLHLTKEDLLQREVEVSGEMYPDEISVGDNALPLHYAFDPAGSDDGVSVDVPLALLNQVSREKLDWLVPGLLPEKCLALIKSLPKSIRKNFVPAPEYASRALEGLDPEQGSLRAALADRLFRMTGMKVNEADFQTESLDKHLSILVRVVDDAGQVLEVGRNLDLLFEKFKSVRPQQATRHSIARSGIKRWDFQDLPIEVTSSQGAIQVKGYPALVDQGDHVDIKVFDEAPEAERAQIQGLTRLVSLTLSDQRRYLERQLTGLSALALQFAARGDAQRLKQDVLDAIFRVTLVEEQSDLRDEDAFKARLEGRGALFESGEKICAALAEALRLATGIELSLSSLASPEQGRPLEDIRQQLAWLFRPGFVASASAPWLLSYPRYLKAIAYRVDKLPGNLNKEFDNLAKLSVFESRLNLLPARTRTQALAFEWLLQEYRISLFAQTIGTRVPVSEKRLEKAWSEFERSQRS